VVYCIGVSKYHNATFLNSLAQSGSNLGNFIYIDTSVDYKDAIVESVSNSLNMAINTSIKMSVSLVEANHRQVKDCITTYSYNE
jgi:hypothetical protein